MPRPFAYLRDPLFLVSLGAYFINRLVVEPIWPTGWGAGHLNDLILIPFWVPIMLFTMRKAGLRWHDGPPTAAEVLIPLFVWAATFELWMPTLDLPGTPATPDPLDILYYAMGSTVATLFWHARYSRGTRRAEAEPAIRA